MNKIVDVVSKNLFTFILLHMVFWTTVVPYLISSHDTILVFIGMGFGIAMLCVFVSVAIHVYKTEKPDATEK